MKKIQPSLVLFLLSLIFHPLAFAADNSASISVNGKIINPAIVDYLFKNASDASQKLSDTEKDALINKLVTYELIFQEAVKAGLDKKTDYQVREELSKRELLVNIYLQDYAKSNPIAESEIKAAYEKYKAELGSKEYKLSQILLETETEAKKMIEQLNKGADFTKIATEKSRDPSVKDNKGDLGWLTLNSMLKPFSDVVANLNKGGVAKDPIQTKYGWHVIKLDDIRDTNPPSYEKAKDAIQKQLAKTQLEKMVQDLRAKAVVIDNSKAKK